MTPSLYIFGTGAHALKVYHCANHAGYTIAAFVDENLEGRTPVDSVPVVSVDAINNFKKLCCLFIAIGSCDVRKRLLEEYLRAGWTIPTIVHPFSNIAPDVTLECGVLVAAGALIESGSVIGCGTIVDIGVVIDHDCIIAPYSHLRPGVVCQPRTYWQREKVTTERTCEF